MLYVGSFALYLCVVVVVRAAVKSNMENMISFENIRASLKYKKISSQAISKQDTECAFLFQLS